MAGPDSRQPYRPRPVDGRCTHSYRLGGCALRKLERLDVVDGCCRRSSDGGGRRGSAEHDEDAEHGGGEELGLSGRVDRVADLCLTDGAIQG